MLPKINIILPLWIIFIMLRSSQMNKVSWVKSRQFISCSSLWKDKAVKLINYSALTQYTLFIWTDLSFLKIIYNGKKMLKSESTKHVLTQTDNSYQLYRWRNHYVEFYFHMSPRLPNHAKFKH